MTTGSMQELPENELQDLGTNLIDALLGKASRESLDVMAELQESIIDAIDSLSTSLGISYEDSDDEDDEEDDTEDGEDGAGTDIDALETEEEVEVTTTEDVDHLTSNQLRKLSISIANELFVRASQADADDCDEEDETEDSEADEEDSHF
jgi:hypothetical protein